MPGMHRGYLGIGSNVGDRLDHVRAALARLEEAGVAVETCSSVWETEPLEGAGPGWFVNLVARIRFDLEPEALLDLLQEIERQGGRTRSRPNEPREIDLDILRIDGVERDDDRLRLPHPRMWSRAFVLAPLAELDPDLRDPATGRTVIEALPAAEGRVRRVGPLDRGRRYNAAALRQENPAG